MLHGSDAAPVELSAGAQSRAAVAAADGGYFVTDREGRYIDLIKAREARLAGS